MSMLSKEVLFYNRSLAQPEPCHFSTHQGDSTCLFFYCCHTSVLWFVPVVVHSSPFFLSIIYNHHLHPFSIFILHFLHNRRHRPNDHAIKKPGQIRPTTMNHDGTCPIALQIELSNFRNSYCCGCCRMSSHCWQFVGCCLLLLSLAITLSIYILAVLESPCLKGCAKKLQCNEENDAYCQLSQCFDTCWKAHWASCPEDGKAVCKALGNTMSGGEGENHFLHPTWKSILLFQRRKRSFIDQNI